MGLGSNHLLLLFIALLIILLVSISKICSAGDSIHSTHFLKDGNTIVSSSGIFEMGFFRPNNNSLNHYVGIWYKQLPIRTVVWVANRDTPITNISSVVLQMLSTGRLALVDANNTLFWYTNSSRVIQSNPPVAKLLDSGNLVIADANDDNPENFLWQSFDHPTDTLLSGMIIGKNFITGDEISVSAWKTEDNPGSGEYKLFLESTGYPELVLRNGGEEVYRSGPWNGLRWSGTPGLAKKESTSEMSVIVNTTGVFAIYKVFNISTLLRIVVSSSGSLQIYLWVDGTEGWKPLRNAPTDVCDTYGYCGVFGSCNYDNYPVCACLNKFLTKSRAEWSRSEFSGGCVRKTPLSCQNGSSSDGFLRYRDIKLPDTKFSWFNKTMDLHECEQVCLKNCNCTAYSSLDISNGENGCLIWFGDLVDIKVLPPHKGQDLFIRMASSDLDYTPSPSSKGKKLKTIKLSSSLLIGLLVLSFTIILIFYKQRRKWKQKEKEVKLKLEQDQTLFEASAITRATDNFSLANKIGEGGYGPVYKGVLDDGREIAVKRLSKTSKQGFEEFKNEVDFIAKLQHRNLVKLFGWCIKGEEEMLIYQYMPNKSLDSFIFDHSRKKLLDWPKRFNIINGIARGLLYLHQDSQLRIIHRDLKASNILLDIDMNPKISDFGLAKCIGRNEIAANTDRVAGTHGYMSPEYAGHGMFSTKSDVFSFGVLVLELVSGKRNTGFSKQDGFENLLSYAWKLYNDGRSIELVDEGLDESCNLAQVLRSMQVGLLCVQQCPEERPSMCSVVQMLTNNEVLPIANEPGFFLERKIIEVASSINEITISLARPR